MPGPKSQRIHRRTRFNLGLLSGLRLHLQIQFHFQIISNISEPASASLEMDVNNHPFERQIRSPNHDSVQRFDRIPATSRLPYRPYNNSDAGFRHPGPKLVSFFPVFHSSTTDLILIELVNSSERIHEPHRTNVRRSRPLHFL
jgi:hypothetical protein